MEAAFGLVGGDVPPPLHSDGGRSVCSGSSRRTAQAMPLSGWITTRTSWGGFRLASSTSAIAGGGIASAAAHHKKGAPSTSLGVNCWNCREATHQDHQHAVVVMD